METKIDILNELKELSPMLASISKANVYTLPNGYFDTLTDELLTTSKVENHSFGKSNTYRTPDGYFDDLATNILSKINEEECTKEYTSTLLKSIGNKNVYYVPTGYFENITTNIVAKAIKANETKVVTMKRNSNWLKYAAAAVFASVVTFGALKLFNTKPDVIPNNAALDKSFTPEKIASINAIDVEKEMDALSDESIINYLQQNTQESDNDVAASFVNENELPNEIDYLLDENTLDDFLNNTKSNSN